MARRASLLDEEEPAATEAVASKGGQVSKEEREARQNDDIFANDGVPDAGPFDPTKEVGVTAPLGFFDPLGLSKGIDRETFRRYRASELKHGRVAMMASIGGVFAHYVRMPLLGVGEVPPGIMANLFRPPVSVYWGILLWLITFTELGWWEETESREPGDFGDPLGVGMYTEEMRNRELNNGRLAMFTGIGILAAEFVSGKDAVQQLGLP